MSIGSSELLLILFVVLLLFGGKRLPEIARNIGKGLAGFRRAVQDIQSDIQNPIETTDRSRPVGEDASNSEDRTRLTDQSHHATQPKASSESSRSDS